MLLLLLAVIHLLWVPVDPVIWAGAMIGQGCYSGGRLVANSIAGAGKVATILQREGARRAASADTAERA